MHRVAVAALVAALLAPPLLPATATTTPAETARAMVARYHEDPAVIDRARDLLEAAVERDRQVATMTALAYVWFLVGEVRATTAEARLEAYDKGRDWGRRAVELAPRDVDAHVWYAINTGRWGQTKGIMRSLFLLPTVREEIDTVLALDPRSVRGHVLAGNVLLELPRLVGGDPTKAEEHFRKALAVDPRYTVARVDLARALVAQGRRDEARRELRQVVAERAPTSIADWTVKDVPRARRLLDEIGAK